MARIYRIHAFATLIVPSEDGTRALTLPCRVRSVRLERNDHNHADQCVVTVDWNDAGSDPRLISNGQLLVWLGLADDSGEWEPNDDDLRFQGIITKPCRTIDEQRKHVRIEAIDYTAVFLRAKPLATKGIPLIDQTLDDAWRTIISGFEDDETGDNEVAELAGALELRGLSEWPRLSKSVAPRFAQKGGRIQVKNDADAWAVWQQCVGMCGLISYWIGGTLVVTTTDSYYSKVDAPVMVWGKNILDISEERDNNFERKGIGITSFNPATGTTIEALWPPVGDDRVKRKRTSAKKKKPTETQIQASEHRDYFSFPAVTDETALLELAKRVYETRSRQEFKGSLKTAEMSVETSGGSLVDMLSLQSGDTIRIVIDEAEALGAAMLYQKANQQDRANYFVSLGYSPSLALLMAERADALTKLRDEFHILAVHTDLEVDDSGGSFSVTIDYCNRIQATGDAKA